MTLPAILAPAALVLLLLFALLALILLVPIDLEGRASWGRGPPETRMRIGWLFGRLHKDFTSSDELEPSEKGVEQTSDMEGEKEEHEEEEEEEGQREVRRGRGTSRIALGVMRTEGFLESLSRLLRGLLGTLQVRSLSIDMRIGLPDPADTGEAVGLLSAALAPLEGFSPVRARIVPSFAGEEIAGAVEGGLRIWPIKAVPPIARFLLSPPPWRAGWKAASALWRGEVPWKRWRRMRPLGWIEERKRRRGKW
ncbi:DUF2953 domain-containing protein [Candidatus Methanocrinis natronophilus]|uniref:DUF2953 domain-containing protein n=1 Tax=Candidatus Methanocrinis natronophilus TaxID=3033396 RepID=A0ABT5X6M2_9EURY|nr:DUF2953 domain-containing protein [Candidatus Methanocrinis natronophilus]MDF0590335.1 DUF2953 domain-containing protein [Candidatus Methanocrinis natronophilus]